MASVAGRVSAAASAFFNSPTDTPAIAVNQTWPWPEKRRQTSWTTQLSTSLPQQSPLPTPLLSWALHSERALPADFVSLVGAAALFCNPLTSCFRLRRSSRDPRVFLMASGGDGACDDGASTAVVDGEPIASVSAAAIQDYKGRQASVAAGSLLFAWSIVSVIAAVALGGLHWLDGVCTKGHKHVHRLEKQSEPVRFWTSISCLLVLWLSMACFLLSQVQHWEMSTMVDDSLASGGSFCHSLWPNTGLGCQLPFTTSLRM